MAIVQITREELDKIQDVFRKYPDWNSVLIEVPDEGTADTYTQESQPSGTAIPFARTLSDDQQVASI